ncbi:hypothetical protein Tco_0913860 [Tanacetum coccineum]
MALARSELAPRFFLPYWGVSCRIFIVFCDRRAHTSHVFWFPCKISRFLWQECATSLTFIPPQPTQSPYPYQTAIPRSILLAPGGCGGVIEVKIPPSTGNFSKFPWPWMEQRVSLRYPGLPIMPLYGDVAHGQYLFSVKPVQRASWPGLTNIFTSGRSLGSNVHKCTFLHSAPLFILSLLWMFFHQLSASPAVALLDVRFGGGFGKRPVSASRCPRSLWRLSLSSAALAVRMSSESELEGLSSGSALSMTAVGHRGLPSLSRIADVDVVVFMRVTSSE